jgi:putative transposase
VLDRLHATIGLPQTIVVDNGPEFADCTLDAWAYARQVTLRFIRPGKPIENAYVEKLQRQVSRRVPERTLVCQLGDAQGAIEAWRVDYNTVRPHSSLGWSYAGAICRDLWGARRLTPARQIAHRHVVVVDDPGRESSRC